MTIGNLHHEYQLRQDRIRRIEDAFRRKSINAHQRARLLEQEGFNSIDSWVSIGESALRVVERIKQ